MGSFLIGSSSCRKCTVVGLKRLAHDPLLHRGPAGALQDRGAWTPVVLDPAQGFAGFLTARLPRPFKGG